MTADKGVVWHQSRRRRRALWRWCEELYNEKQRRGQKDFEQISNNECHWSARCPQCEECITRESVVAAPTCMCSFLLVIFKHRSLPALSEDPGRSIPGNGCRTFPGLNLQENPSVMFSPSLPQLHCKAFAKMGDDKPFVCSAPGCGQVSSLSLCLGFQVWVFFAGSLSSGYCTSSSQLYGGSKSARRVCGGRCAGCTAL